MKTIALLCLTFASLIGLAVMIPTAPVDYGNSGTTEVVAETVYEIPKVEVEKVNPSAPVLSEEKVKNIAKEMKKLPILELRERNTLVFDEVVTDESVAAFQQKLFSMSARLPANEPIYMVLYTPGGSVFAGAQLIESTKAIPQEVKTLTIFAASMGFQFVQNMGERLILPSGTLMSHRASLGGLSGELGGELEIRLNYIKKQVEFLELRTADRMDLSLKDYRDLIRDEYWVYGFESKPEKVADKLVLARCSKEMLGVYWKTINTLFGSIKLKMSKCPLITAPLGVDFSLIQDPVSLAKSKDFIHLYYSSPDRFYRDYIENAKYLEYLR